MTKLGDISVRTALLCEDVRQEKSNKFILIGVFANDIVLSTMPAAIPISFFIELKSSKLGTQHLYFRISGPGNESAKLKIGLDIKDAESVVAIPGPKLDIRMDADGVFKIDASTDEKRWVNLIAKKVWLDPSIEPKEHFEPSTPQA